MEETVDTKNNRNLPILRKMLEEDPANLKTRVQLAKELKDHEERCAFYRDSVEFMRPLTKHSEEAKLWLMVLCNQYHRFALQLKDYALVDTLMEHWENHLSGSIFELNFLGFCTEAYLSQGAKTLDLLVQTFPQYQAMFQKQRKQSDASFQLLDFFEYVTELQYYQVEFRSIHKAIEAGKNEEASCWLKQSRAYTYQTPEGKHKYIFDVVLVCFLLNEYEFLSQLFRFATEKSSPQELQLLVNELEKSYHSLEKEQKREFLSVFPWVCTHWFVALMKLRFYDNDITLCPKEVQELLKNTPNLSNRPILAPLLYSYLLTGEDPISYLEQVTLEHLEKLEATLLQRESTFDSVLLRRLKSPLLMKNLSLTQKQLLGHLGVSLALRCEQTSSETLSIFWTGVSLLVEAVAERGNFSTWDKAQKVEQVSVLLWQNQEDQNQFVLTSQKMQILCAELSPILQRLGKTPPLTLWQETEKKQRILETIQALYKAKRDIEANQLLQAMTQAYPQEPFALFVEESSTDPVEAVQQALKDSLDLLDTPLSQAKKQFLEKNYRPLL